MADFIARIKPKKSSVSGESPLAADLEVAEIAVNTADGKLFVKHTDGSIKEISGSGGGGVGTADGSVRTSAPRATTASLAKDASEDVTFTQTGRAGQFLQVEASCASWVVFYASQAARTADAGRLSTENPPQGAGVLMEVFFDQAEVALITPSVLYFNNDANQGAEIYAKVTNLDAVSQPVTVTATVVPIEGRAVYEAEGTVRSQPLSVKTSLIGNDTSEELTLGQTARSGQFVTLQTSHAARVIFYSNKAARTADASRAQGLSPATSSGVLLEVVTTGAETLEITPAVLYQNTESGAAGELYMSVTNLSGADAEVEVITTVIPIEGRGAYLSELHELLDVNASTPSDGEALVYDAASSKWVPGTVSGSGGGGGTTINQLEDVADVSTLSYPNTIYTNSFESGEPAIQGTGTLSTTVFRTGSRSHQVPTGVDYGEGGYLEGVWPASDSTLRYDVVRLYIRSNGEFDTTNRLCIGANKQDVTGGTKGFAIYTRDTGFAFYSNNNYSEYGVMPSMVADTWYEIVYVLDWANGRDNIPAAFSLWVDGQIAVDSAVPANQSIPYTQPDTAEHERFYFAQVSGSAASDHNRFIDDLSVRSTQSLEWLLSDATIDATNFFDAGVASTPNNSIIRYDSSLQEWKAVDYSLSTLRQAGYVNLYQDGDTSKPYARFRPDNLGDVIFDRYDTPASERWGLYTTSSYGVAVGKYHLPTADGGTISDERQRADESRRTYYSDEGIIHNMGDKPLWLNGALGTYSDNTPEMRWGSGNPTSGTNYYVGLKLPAGTAQTTTYTFPDALPADDSHFLRTDTNGNLSWSPVGLDFGSPLFSLSSGIALNYEEDGTDSSLSYANGPSAMSTDAQVGTKSIRFNVNQSDGEYCQGAYPASPFGDSNYLGTRAFTFQTWFKNLNPELPGTLTRYHRMISGAGTANLANRFQVRTNGSTTGTQGAWQLHDDAPIVTGGTAVTDTNWHHLAIQHDGFGVYRMFLDGAIDGTATLEAPKNFEDGSGFILGGRGDFVADTFFQGNLDATELIVGVELYSNTGFTPPTTPAGRTIVLQERTQIELAKLEDLSDVSDTAPTDGQALVWDDAASEWKPGTVSGGGGAVDSVNGETGVVSLGVFDLTNVEKVPNVATTTFFYNSGSCSSPTGTGSTWADGSIRTITSSGTLYATDLDANGEDFRAAVVTKVANFGLPLQFWVSADGATGWSSHTTSSDPSSNQNRLDFINAGFTDCSRPIYITLEDPAGASPVVEPLAGDVLAWNSTDQKFKPAQLPAAPVDSVNGETGAVSLGIQDMNDFGLNLITGDTWDDDGSEGASPVSPGSWSSTNNRFSRYAADGTDRGAELDALAVGSDIWYGAPGAGLTQSTIATTRTDFSATGVHNSNVGFREFTITGTSLSSFSSSGIVLAFSDPASSSVPLAEGDILQWVDAAGEFKPAQLPAIPAAPVDSVNGETGVVSLGVQEMDDFAYQLGASVYNYTVDATDTPNPPTGTATKWTGVGDAYVWFSTTDKDGRDAETDLYALSASSNATILVNGAEVFSGPISNPSDKNANRMSIRFNGDQSPIAWITALTAGDIVGISSTEWTTQPAAIPPAEGDILQWDNADQKFKPAQLPADGGTVASLDDVGDVEYDRSFPTSSWTTPNTGNPGADEYRVFSSGLFRFSTTTANGYEKDALLASLVLNANVSLLINGVTHVGTVTTAAYLEDAGTATERVVGSISATPALVNSNVSDTSLVLTYLDEAIAVVPPTEGDILQWDNADQKFKPAQLPATITKIIGGTFGSGY